MTDFGVQSTGFVIKPLPTILAEIEALMATQFGSDVIQTASSPLGQLNGLFASLAAHFWEIGEDVYQSYDPDQAEGRRLEMLARLRLVERVLNETDESFRRAITNAGSARVDTQDLARAISNLDGVTYAQIFVNDGTAIDEFTIPPATIAVAVTGGDVDEIAQVMRTYIVPGVSTYGNEVVSTVIDGYCRSMTILRPIEIEVTLEVRVIRFNDRAGCPPPDTTAIKAALVDGLYLLNGDDISFYRVRQVIESAFPGTVEVSYIIGERDDIVNAPNEAVLIGFIERAVISMDTVTVLDA